MESSIDREDKLDTLLDLIGKMMYILDKKLERHEADTDVDYPEQPMSSLDQKQTQPLKDINNKQNMYDEQDYRENNEECCQESPDSMPLSFIALLREIYDQNENTKSEQYFEETITLLGDTKLEIEEVPQSYPASTSRDSLREAQEDIQPENQPT